VGAELQDFDTSKLFLVSVQLARDHGFDLSRGASMMAP